MPLGSSPRSNHGHVAVVRIVTRTLLATVHGVETVPPFAVVATAITLTLWAALPLAVSLGLEQCRTNQGLSRDIDAAAEAAVNNRTGLADRFLP